MSMKTFKEFLVGKYDGVAPPTGLGMGTVVGGQNMRKVSLAGGWKARKGCAFHNTTAIAAASILSLHQYTHPRNLDYHFMAQCNGNLYDATNDPPANGAAFASATLTTLASSSQSGFSDIVDEAWIYADGDGAPIMWEGDNPFCRAFMVYDGTSTAYVDQTRKVRDQRSDTYATVLGGADDKLYVCSPLPAKAITLTLGANVNSNDVDLVVKDYNGAWAAVASLSDGTDNSGTLAQSGAIEWTSGGDEKKLVIGGVMGFWYELSWSGALSGTVYVVSCTLEYDPARIINKWDGAFEMPLAVRRYEDSTGIYKDVTGYVTNQSTSQGVSTHWTTSDFLYVKSVEPIFAIAFGMIEGEESSADAQIDRIEWWDGDSWESITTLSDGTLDSAGDSSFAQSGILQWDPSGTAPVRRTFSWDSVPGYWYRVSVDAETTEGSRAFFIAVAVYPEEIPAYAGVVQFKSRALLWGDPEFPNRLRYGAYLRVDAFSGSDSGWTKPFGDANKIVVCRRFYNELLVWKARSIYLLEGYDPRTFGILEIADTVGCCAPATAFVVEAGFPDMHKDEPLTVAIWMDTDGVYIIDGRKPKKVSLPVDHFFNPEYTSCISAANLPNCKAFVDPTNNEYHLLIPDGRELVYNYVSDEWYPPWDRRVGGSSEYLVCGLSLRGTDGRYYTYGGNNGGEVFKLETDTSDKSESNADVAITHSVKTRAICANPQMSTVFEFVFRKLWMEAKTRSAGSVTVNFYKDLATAPVELDTPGAPSLVRTGYGVTADGVYTSQAQCLSFQIEFEVSTVDVELELWSFLYQLDATAEIVIG